MEGSVCKLEIGGGLARNLCHKAMFGFFDHTRVSRFIQPYDTTLIVANSMIT